MSDRYRRNGRCIEIAETTGERCEFPAAPGADRCLQHGGADEIRAALALADPPSDTDADDD